MRKTTQFLIIAVLGSTLAIGIGSPAQAACQQIWEGTWHTTVNMDMTTVLKQDGREVRGHYSHAGDPNGDGRIFNTEAQRDRDCMVIIGEFKGDMRGVFRLVMDGTFTSFEGWYKICRFVCIGKTKHPWTANLVT